MRSVHAKLRLRPIWITPAVLFSHAPWPQGQTSYTYHIAQSPMRWWRQDSDVIDMLTLEDDEVHLVSWRRFNHPQCKQHQWSFGRKSMNLRNFQTLLWITTFRSPGFALDHTFHVYSLWGPIINYINRKYEGLLVQSLIDFNAMKAHNTPRFATVMARNTIYKSVSYTPFVASYNPIVLATKNWNF